MFRVICIVVLLSSLAGCSKDPDSHPHTKIYFPYNSTLRDIVITNDSTWIVCGGDERSGIVVRTHDRGNTWTISPRVFDYPVNCLYFLDENTGFAGDEDIIIYKTIDGGMNWNPFYDTSWPLTVNRNLRAIWFTGDSTGFVCGGKNLGNGVLYNTRDGGNDWDFREFNHEYRGICFADSNNGVMAGYGSLLRTSDGGENFESTGYNKYYFTGICIDHFGQYLVCDFNGTVLKSSDKGISWQEIRDGSAWSMSGSQLNCIDVSPSGNIICAGPNGFVTWSTDNGNSWSDKTSFGGKDILKVKWISGNEAIAVGKNGGVFTLKI